MRLTLKNALRVASVPVGVGVGLWTTQLWTVPRCPPNTHCPALVGVLTFAPWQSALFGAAAAGWLALVSLVVRSGRNVVSALRVASVPSGVGVGLWTAQLMIFPSCPRSTPSVLYACSWQPTFATWLCALLGAAAAAVVFLASEAVARLPSPS